MPQLAKGGKWVFGWCVVGAACEIQIPPKSYAEYGFQTEESVIITRGSRRSGGFGIGRPEKLGTSPLQPCFVGQVKISAEGQVTLPPETGVRPGERLLAVRGSRLALGFVQCGPIYEEALKHPEIEIYLWNDRLVGGFSIRQRDKLEGFASPLWWQGVGI